MDSEAKLKNAITKVAQLILYSWNDIESYDGLTEREKEIVGSQESFEDIDAWATIVINNTEG